MRGAPKRLNHNSRIPDRASCRQDIYPRGEARCNIKRPAVAWFHTCFSLVYDAYYLYQGTYLVFLIALYWIMLSGQPKRLTLAWRELKSLQLLSAFYVIIPIMLVLNRGVIPTDRTCDSRS